MKLLHDKFNVEKFSRKIKNWPVLTDTEFKTEIKKQNKQISLNDVNELVLVFKRYSEEAENLDIIINTLESEIDQLVYELYGLTEEEIRIVEESVNK